MSERAAAMAKPLSCAVDGGVALITFNRPKQLNAFTEEMGDLFDETMVRLQADESVRAVVMTGTGRGFCVGSDMSELKQTTKAGGSSFPRPEEPASIFDAFADAPAELRARYVLPLAMSKPVIAAVNGACAGIGLALAVSSDVRFASEEAMFTAIFARRGLTAETGLAYTLTALVGLGAASDMLLSARRVSAAEAKRMGLVNEIVPADELLAHTMVYAKDIADNVSPRSTRVIKRQLWQAQQQTFMEAAIVAYREAGRSLKSEDFREGIAHFVERRPPRFTGK
jgi:enoyl-CoA hydratase/carnithine racemase